ncbi:MAG: hypothetical protein ABEJ79_11355 [Halolamina sp.]
MTVASLLSLRSVPDFAPWVAAGGEYVDAVTETMGFDGGDAVDFDSAVEAMAAGRTDVSPRLAEAVATTLLADARFCAPFTDWTPRWYAAALAVPIGIIDRKLTRVARPYAAVAETASAPPFSRPGDAYVGGEPAVAGVSGFRERFLLADAVLHLEWYVGVARAAGVAVPPELVARTRRETLSFYAGDRDRLSERPLRFQRALFADDRWVARVDDAYDLDSALFGLWRRLLREERQRLQRATPA